MLIVQNVIAQVQDFIVSAQLDHPDIEVRAWAANVLGHERDKDLGDLVNRALSHTLQHDAHSWVRYWAARALGNRSYDHFTTVIEPALCAAKSELMSGIQAKRSVYM